MSLTNEQLDTILDASADMDWFISQGEWSKAQAVIDATRELGYEHEADLMRKSYLRAQNEFLNEEFTFVPFSHEKPPALEVGWQEKDPPQGKVNGLMEAAEQRYQDYRENI